MMNHKIAFFYKVTEGRIVMVKYIEIADDLRSKIQNQTYTYGQKLPYEYVLCVSYHCNKETMKKALEILVKEGLIVRRRGAGTFVKDYDPGVAMGSENQGNLNIGLTRTYGQQKKVTSKVITFEVVPSDAIISNHLQIEEGSFVYHIIRQRFLDEDIYSLEDIYIPISILPDLSKDVIEKSIYQYVENGCNFKIQSMHKTIRSFLSTTLEQKYLLLKENEPYIEIEQLTFLSSGVIFEFSRSRFHYRDFNFHIVSVK